MQWDGSPPPRDFALLRGGLRRGANHPAIGQRDWRYIARSVAVSSRALPMMRGRSLWELPMILGASRCELPMMEGASRWELPMMLGASRCELPMMLGASRWELPMMLGASRCELPM